MPRAFRLIINEVFMTQKQVQKILNDHANEQRGTPKTMHEALANGLASAQTICMTMGEADHLAFELERHVKDFLSQRFGAALLSANDSNCEQLIVVLAGMCGVR
jgi:hypothetical protein